jgi:hypothetical protein
MKHQEWKDRWLNIPIKFTEKFGAQCVDVMRQYAADVHGIRDIEVVNGAVDFFTRHNSRPVQMANYFAISYQEGLATPQGAFIIWGGNSNNGNFGHVAVCDTSTQTELTILDQDGFDNPARDVNLGSVNGMRKRTVSYNNVLGWLVLKENRNNTDNRPVPANGKYPPANAIMAPSDTNGRVGEFWFSPSTRLYMTLTAQGWRNI